ncbi:MAG: hypothetical protein Kow00120_06620 [Anaerolineae bacterium]
MQTPWHSDLLRAVRRWLLRRVPAPDFTLPEADALPGDPRVFQHTDAGSGAFGVWTLDANGLPAYEYQLDQYSDVRATYPNTEGVDRRDHWHQVGNDRVTAMASNDGTVQLYMADRGGVFLNRFEANDSDRTQAGTWLMRVFRRLLAFLVGLYRRIVVRRLMRDFYRMGMPRGDMLAEPAPHAPDRTRLYAEPRHAYAGGYAYLDDGEAAWATAYRYRPAAAETRRVFGMSYFETETTYRGLRAVRRVYAPAGDNPALLIDVRIENLRETAVDLRYYEYWDVNVYQLQLQWVRSGLAAFVGDEIRRAINEQFTPGVAWDANAQALRFHQEPPATAPPPTHVSGIDWAPADVFLADLTGSADGWYTDKAAFFGAGSPALPEAVRTRRDGELAAPAGNPMPCCLVLRRDLHLQPGATATLRYAYGAVRPGQSLDFLAPYRTGDPLVRSLDAWREQLAYFSTGRDPVLQREMAWHAYNLLSATVYNAYYDAHVVAQGSAYLYLHGADGAPRDLALVALPSVYLRPDLARDILRVIMGMTDAATGQIGYAFAGYGVQDGAMIHDAPSDLDLFFLLALAEYLAATGDMAFLDVETPFYPREAQPPEPLGATVLDHVRLAVKHLIEEVGVGAHGLIRVSDGDWSDGVVVSSALEMGGLLGFVSWFNNTKAHGESVPNTQMALYVLPLVAALVEARDPELTACIRAFLPGLRDAVAAQWTGAWYTRAILRDDANRPIALGQDQIFLESQPWAIISGLAAELGHTEALVDAITSQLDDPSPIGAMLLPRQSAVWPAVSQLLTWAYARSYPDLAWRSLERHTFAVHAHAFPNVWLGIWSGPDGVNSIDAPNPGGTWASPVTPMTDFPVMNANQDAMALLGLLRVCGVEPSPAGDGLTIAPRVPRERFILDLPLLRLEVEPRRIAGVYRAAADGQRVLYVRIPEGATGVTAVAGAQLAPVPEPAGGDVALPLAFRAGEAVPFEVTWEG